MSTSDRHPASAWFRCAFSGMADAQASRLGGPVYLVGSALWSPAPNDYDVRVVLSEHDEERLFGGRRSDGPEIEWVDDVPIRPAWMRRYREELKQSRRMSRLFGVNVDFQFQTLEAFCRNDGPRLRLDHHPKWFFLAGLTDA